jgi:hypothetical protein
MFMIIQRRTITPRIAEFLAIHFPNLEELILFHCVWEKEDRVIEILENQLPLLNKETIIKGLETKINAEYHDIFNDFTESY